jgi:hypothetical protein
MADESPPLSTTVPETVTVDLGVDKEQLGNLEDSFKDFWEEADKADKAVPEAPPAPEAPSAGPAQETEKKAEGEPEAEVPPEEPKARKDEDIDKLELSGPNPPRPEHLEQFKKIKDLWKADQRRAEEYNKRIQAMEAELAAARQNAWTPEARADYEHAATIRRRFDILSDPEFRNRYEVPIRAQFEKILDETGPVLYDPNEGRKWAEGVKANYQANNVSRAWWDRDVVAKIPNEFDRNRITNRIDKLFDLQDEMNAELAKHSSDKDAYDKWKGEKDQVTRQQMQDAIMSEIREQEQRIKEVLPVDVEKAKTTEERQAMEAHNARFEKLNEFFKNQLNDLSNHGPRAWVRVAVEATRTQVMNDQIVNLEKDLKDTRAERDKLKAELDKITGARRRIAHTTGTPPSSQQSKNGQGLSIKDLDVRKSFDSFNWGDNA